MKVTDERVGLGYTHNARVEVINWTPGDGTLYEIVVARVPASAKVVLTYLNTRHGSGRSMLLWSHENSTAPHWTYISEKMGLGEYDAKMMARFLVEILGYSSGRRLR